MFLLEIAILSILIGLIRRGSLKNFFTGGLKVWFLFIISIILFIGTKVMCIAGVNVLGSYSFYIVIAAYVILFVALFFNLDGIWPYILLLGALLNFVILILNGGLMPVSQTALNLAGLSATNYMDKFSAFMAVADDSTIFLYKYLGAIIPLPLPSILGEVLTPGTIVMAIGSFGMIQSIMTTQYMDEDQYNQYMNELSSDDQAEAPILDSADDEEKMDYTTNIDQDELDQFMNDSDNEGYDDEDDLFAGIRDEDENDDDSLFEELEEPENAEDEDDIEEDEYEDLLDDDEDLDPMADFDEDIDPMEELEEEPEEEPEEEEEEIPTDDDDMEEMLDDAFGFDSSPEEFEEETEPEEVEEDDNQMATGSELDALIAETLGGTADGYDEDLLDELRNLGKEDEVEEITEEDEVEEEPEDTEPEVEVKPEPDDASQAYISNIRNAQEMLKRVGSRVPKDETINTNVPDVDTESPFIISNGRIVENPYYKLRRGKIRQDAIVDSPDISDSGLYVMSSGGLAKMNESNGKVQAIAKENAKPIRERRRVRKSHIPNVTTTPGFDEEKEETSKEVKPAVSSLIDNPYDKEPKETVVATQPTEKKVTNTENKDDNYVHTSRNNIIDEEGNEVPNPYEQVEMKIGDVEIKFWKKDNQ